VVNDPSGFSSSTGLSLVGGASVTGGALEMTDGGTEEARAVWYGTPVNVQNFTTDFSFQITPASTYIGDGFTFTLQNAAAGVEAIGTAGGDLGYAGIGSSVAVKFDLYSNAGEGSDSTGFYTDGAVPTVPAVDMTASGVNLHSGDTMHAHITYDGTTLTLTLTDTVTNASFTTSTAINIPTTVGGDTAYAGFTAGDWSLTSTQKILNWTYVVNSGTSTPVAATPTFSPVAGTYSGAQSVTISDTTSGAVIHYTTNGTTPTASSATYSTPIAVSSSETIEAIAVASGYTTSAVGSAAYTIGSGSSTTVVNDPSGFSSSTGLSLVDGASVTGGALELTDGGTEEARAVWYGTPVNVQNFTTDFSFQITPASTYIGDGFTFTLQNAAAGVEAIGTAGGDLGYAGIGSSVAVKFDLYSNAGEGSDSTGFYTDGAVPTVPAVDMTASGVNLHSGDTMHAHITYDGTTLTLTLTDTVTNASFTTSTAINIPTTVGGDTAYAGFTAGDWSLTSTQKILNWTYVVNSGTSTPVAATPTFSPVAGTYSGAQSVTISDTTSGAVIYYTTNGTMPTTGSATYSTPIAVSASETIEAIAVASGYTTSAVGSAVYTIGGSSPAATPTFSPVAGTYSGAQSVTISDTTSGAVIHYTTNGTTPTTGSATYSTPIAVSSSETIEAIAVASGYTTSAVGSAAYTIGGSSTTVVNDPSGFSSSTGLSLVGGASVTGGALEMTDGGTEEARAVWYGTPVNVQNFTTDFSFQITPASTYIGDGFTFTLQNAAAGVEAIGTAGGDLGYAGIGSSVAVKFDLYSNAGEGSDSTGFYTDGAVPTVPAVDMTASGVNLHSGDTMHAHITYDGTTLTLTLTDTVTNASFTTSTAINIPTTVGGDTAYAGFTAGDWSLTSTQEILNWTYVVN
jgi:hypothetical protein